MVVTALALGTLGTAFAADGEEHTPEVVGYGGFQHFPGAAKGQVGGAIGRVPDGNSVVFAETSYAPLGFGENVLNFGGGFNFGFRTRIDNLVPYIPVVGGLGPDMVSGGGSSNYVLFGAGFGAHFLGSNWGVRPEFRWQRYQQPETGPTPSCSWPGLFYRFG
jgi:hypothetical protein